MNLHSYHMFLFPFQWEPKGKIEEEFSKRCNLDKIKKHSYSNWANIPSPKTQEYEVELYNEKNFFYKFVHTALYDEGNANQPVIKHFERQEAYESDLVYEIGVIAKEKKIYSLKLKSIGLDLFSTGTGVLIFYLENHQYPDLKDVMKINQFGRRIFPPFLDKNNLVDETKKRELADYISIKGLNGESYRYHEDFTQVDPSKPWGKARFIESLIDDFSSDLQIEPVIDDRMFTMCLYFNNELGKKIADVKQSSSIENQKLWHEYIFVDADGCTCQNDMMLRRLIQNHTYLRWQNYGTLHGVTRYSFMTIAKDDDFAKNSLLTHFRTIYMRLTEIVLVQRASILKFSDEVSRLSSLDDSNREKLTDRISDFYKSYIRFVNQIYFREVTAQEQGIELYDMLTDKMRIKDQVKDLDNEIGELHNYVSLLDEKSQSRNLGLLTILGSLFLLPSFIVGYFGMNFFGNEPFKLETYYLPVLIGIITLVAFGLLGIVRLNKKEKRFWVNILIIITALLILALMIAPAFL